MGFQPASQLATEYFKAIKGKSVGYISPPVRTQFGYHIIKVLAAKSYEKIKLEFVHVCLTTNIHLSAI